MGSIALKPYSNGLSVREACRQGIYNQVTAGLAPSHIQANLIVLPSRYATDFRLLCLRNQAPCSLVAESKSLGNYNELRSWLPGVSGASIAADLDIRGDCPKYTIYNDGKLMSVQENILTEWTEDHVAFLVGCSYSFETALTKAGLTPPHVLYNRNVAMYRTSIPLCPAGVFTGSTYVVSMRVYRQSQIQTARDVTKPYSATHGEPLAWGWDGASRIGIKDVATPEWGDPPVTSDGILFTQEFSRQQEREDDPYVPVFWGCGVTPQEAVMRAHLKGTVMGHAPGHMLLLDIKEDEMLEKTRLE